MPQRLGGVTGPAHDESKNPVNDHKMKEVVVMEVLEAIRTRRSIRQFQERPVPEDLIEKLLRAAMSAPSARNGQPWQFVVIT
jgi:hypothetical protein